MSGKSKNHEARLNYLLGSATLSEEEKSRLEDEFFADDRSFEELEIAEEELIDAYVGNRLSPTDQQAFQKRLLSSSRLRDQVEFARLFAEKIDQAAKTQPTPSPKPQSWWRRLTIPFAPRPALNVSFALALLLVAATAILLTVRWRVASNRNAAEQVAAQRREAERQAEDQAQRDKRAQDKRLVQQPGETQPQNLIHTLATVSLVPGGSRSLDSGNPALLIGSDTKTIEITLQGVPTDYANFMVAVRTSEGRTVIQEQVTRKGSTLTLSVPAGRLAVGDYIVHIDGMASSGAESVNDYTLKVVRLN